MAQISEPMTVKEFVEAIAEATPLTGNELIDKIGKEANLDRYFDRNPRTLTDDELLQLVEIERGRRALFIEKKGK